MKQNKKKILYVGQVHTGSTCLARMRSLQELGHEIVAYDTSAYSAYPNKLLRSMAYRWNIGPPVRQLNQDLNAFSSTLDNSITHVWLDKAKWLYPETVKILKEKTGAKLVHYTPDPQLVFNKSVYFESSLPLYDIMFTTKPFEMAYYQRVIGHRIVLVHQSYDSTILHPRILSKDEMSRFGSDICFIGRCEPYYAKCLKVSTRTGGKVKIWGPGWRRHTRIHKWSREVFVNDGVWAEEYALALNATKIGICLLSKRYPETTTTRTFEIPGCGTFMLAERNEQHQALFEEGKEAEFFSCEGELLEKMNYYLENPEKRKKIAAAGFSRCERSGYSNIHKMQWMVETIDKFDRQGM